MHLIFERNVGQVEGVVMLAGNWFASNAGWFGPAVAVALALIGWRIQFVLSQRKDRGASQPMVRQRQRGGKQSTNIQISDISQDRTNDHDDGR